MSNKQNDIWEENRVELKADIDKVATTECPMKGRMSQCSGKAGVVCFHQPVISNMEKTECSKAIHNNGDGQEPCECNNYGNYEPIPKQEIFDATGYDKSHD